MKVIDQIDEFKRISAHPLTIDGQNVFELSKQNPRAAYDLIFKAMEQRGGLKPFIAHRERQSCIQAVMAKPLPGAAGDAFTASDMRVNGRLVYAVVPTHFRVLQALDSPLLKLVGGLKDGKAQAEIEESAEWEICYVFTTPPRQLRLKLKSEGVDAIRKAAELLCDGEYEADGRIIRPGWTAAEINMTVLAAVAQLKEHIKTTVAFESEAESSGTTFFAELRAQNALSSKAAESASSSAI